MFVKALGGEHETLGIGKQINRQGDVASVEYFDGPWNPAVTVTVPVTELKRTVLPEQTRVYHLNMALGAWEVGRLLDDQGSRLYCKFPNGSDRWLPVADVFVRWARPIADPTAFLASKLNETPRFSDGDLLPKSLPVMSRVLPIDARSGQ